MPRRPYAGWTALAALVVSAFPLAAQQRPPGPDSPLPVDENVKIGTLENGIRYYIRQNSRPENRAELRLVVDAGSVLEDEDQLGLAHFVEHMAFNGTKNFEKQELVDFLESIGMRFGPDVNAYTSFDETVYMLQVPTDSARQFTTAFQILEDWAHNVSFDADEVGKERGVVIEEWRLGQGAGARIRDRQFPKIFKDSRYAERLPIGEKEVLDAFDREDAVRFYRDWYRPDLMAVVAVGDFDPAQVEGLIRRHFAGIAPAQSPRERRVFPVPPHDETLVAAATDPELTYSQVAVLWKQPLRERNTLAAYRQGLVETLYNRMLNARMSELLQKPNPPFLGAGSGQGRMVRSSEIYQLGAAVADNGIERGLDAILTEAERVARHGFAATELERQKTDLLRDLQKAYDEREKTESRVYASEYVRHFLEGEPVPGIANEYRLAQTLLPTIRLEEANALAAAWMTDRNRVIVASAPSKEGVAMPGEQQLLAVFEAVEAKTVEPYVDAVSSEPLVAQAPKPGPVVEERAIAELGVTEWRLANGVRVVLKPTDFKEDQVVFQAFSPGGTSLVPDDRYFASTMASSVVGAGGIADFDAVELRKMLAGKQVRINPWISGLEEGLSGEASPKDIETAFQLAYLHFTSPRVDSAAYQSLQQRLKGIFANRSADPMQVSADTLQVTLAQHHFRARPLSPELFDEMDLGTAIEFYRDRFADAGDFTFVFVGNFEPDSIRPLVETYLGGLPAAGRQESWRDVEPDPPTGVIEKTVRKGVEPKSYTRIVFAGEEPEYSEERGYALASLADVMRIRLREVMREDMGGTYGVGVSAAIDRTPDVEFRVSLNFGSEPGRVDELTAAAFAEIERLKTEGPTAEEIAKVKEIQRRSNETNLEENRYWLSRLVSSYRYAEDPRDILEAEERIDSLTAEMIRDVARRYLRGDNYVKVVLVPETVP